MPRSILLMVVLAGGLALLYLGFFAVTATAPDTLSDGYVYPVKEFEFNLRENLRSSEAEAGQEHPDLVEVTSELIFYQKGESVLDVGGLSVLPGFPDGSSKLVPMIWIGDPGTGDKVRLTYRMVEGKPNFVYGVRLEALSNKLTKVDPADGSSLPTAIPTFSPMLCEPVRPEGWVLYRATVDDSLVSLAILTGTPLRTILSVNCRTDVQLAIGVSIFLPAVPGITVPNAS